MKMMRIIELYLDYFLFKVIRAYSDSIINKKITKITILDMIGITFQ